GVFVTGGYAYLADGSSGLAIIDVSDPANPGTPVYRDTSGNSYGVFVSGGYAYVGDGDSGLAIIDVSDPANPGTPVYRDTSGNSYGVFVSGGYAYVGDRLSGLAIIDVSDPANPGTPIYRDTSGESFGVYVTGGYAYVADRDSDLAIIDVSDPANPGTPIYRSASGDSYGIHVTGGYAYLANGGSGLVIIDVIDPTNPGTPIYRSTSDFNYGVYVIGGYAYLGVRSSGLAIVDVSDPANPGTPVYQDTPGFSMEVYVTGGYAYMADYDYGLRVIDVSSFNYLHPVFSAVARDNCGNVSSANAVSVTIDALGPRISIADPLDGDCFRSTTVVVSGMVIDPDPSSGISGVTLNGVPVEITGGCWVATLTGQPEGPLTLIATALDNAGNSTDSTTVDIDIDTVAPNNLMASPPGDIYCPPGLSVALSCDDIWATIYYTTDGSGPTTASPIYIGLIDISEDTTLKFMAVDVCGNQSGTVTEIYDIDDENPTISIISPTDGSYLSSTTVVVTGTADDMTGSGVSAVLVNGEIASGTYTWSITFTDQYGKPIEIGYRDTSGNSRSVYVTGGYAYVADYGSGLAIIDVSDPANPGTPVYRDTNGNSVGVYVTGGYAYLADYSSLAIIDVSDPTNPGTPVYRDTLDYSLGVYVTGGYAYLANWDKGLAIIDVSDPANPGTPVYQSTSDWGYGVYVTGGYAYLAVNQEGLAIIDVSDPANPGTPVYRDSTDISYGVHVAGGYAYLANRQSGLAIIDVSDPANPGTPAYRDTSGWSTGVYVTGGYAHVADGSSGLAVIDVSDPANPGTPIYHDTPGYSRGVYVTEGYAYVADHDYGLRVIDISNFKYPYPVFYTVAMDECGNISPTATVGVTIDTLAPTISIATPTNGDCVNGTTVVVTGSVSDPDPSSGIAGVWVNGVTAEIIGGSWVATLTGQSEGSLTLTANAMDAVDNSAESAPVNITVDFTISSGTILINGGSICTNSADVTLSLTYDPDVVQMRISTDGILDTEPWQAVEPSPIVTLPAPDGLKTVLVQFQDTCNNISTPVSDDITLDTQAPTGLAATPTGGSYCPTLVTLTVSDGTIYYTTDGSGPTTASPIYTVPIDINMNTTLKFMAVDTCGNQSGTVTELYDIDNENPTIAIISPTNGSYLNSTTVVLSGTADDGTGSGIAAVLVNGYTASGTNSWNITLTSNQYAGPVEVGFRDTADLAYGVFVSGDYAYVADRLSGLAIIDVSDPANPGTPVYRDTSGDGRRVYVTGGYAYMTTGSSGLAIIDVSDPANPGTPVYRDTTGSSWGVYVTGGYAYVGDRTSGLAIIDVSDPNNPGTPVYRDTAGSSYGVYVTGGYAYIADQVSGLAIIDVSDPANPGTPVFRDTFGDGYGVYVTSGYAYFADRSWGLAIIDVSDPANPGTPIYRDTSGYSYTVYVTGGYAYMADGSSGLAIIDVSDPVNPGTPVYQDTPGNSMGVYVTGGYAYMADNASGLRVIDVSSFNYPVFSAVTVDNCGNTSLPDTVSVTIDTVAPEISIATPINGECINISTIVVSGTVIDPEPSSGITGVWVNGVTAEITGGTWVATLTGPSEGSLTLTANAIDAVGNSADSVPVNISIDYTQPTVSIISPTNGIYLNTTTVVVSGTADDGTGSGIAAVLVNGETAAGTYSWSITFTNQYGEPFEVGFRDTSGFCYGVYVTGDYAYVAAWQSGLAIIDVSDPANPGPPVYRDTTGSSSGVYVTGGYAYVSDWLSGLAIIDVSDPANPGTPVYRDTSGSSSGVYVTGGYAYVADRGSGLAIIDVSDPTNPGTPIYRDTSGSSSGVYVTGGYAYLADGIGGLGLAIIDVSDPANPGTPVYRDTSGNSIGVYVAGGYAYVADDTSGLAIIDVSDPANPGTPVYRDTSGNSYGVYVTGGYAFLADYGSDLAIIDVSDPANPGTPVYQDTVGSSRGVYVTGGYAYMAAWTSGLGIVDVSCFSPRIYDAIAMDNCGNASLADTVSVLIDTAAPAISITTPTNGDCVNSTTVVVTGTVIDPEPSSGIAGVWINGVSAEITGGSWVVTLTGQSEGSLTLTANAMDAVGNSADSAPVNITVDFTPPDVPVASPAGGSYCPTTVSLTASDGTIYYTTDGSEPTTASPVYAGPIGISADTTLKFMAVDTCGYQSGTVTEVYDIDTEAGVTITEPVTGTTVYVGDVKVTGTADIDITAVTVTSDQGHSESSPVDAEGDWSVVLTGVTVPSIAITAIGTDDCSNTGSDSVTVSIIADPPDAISITAPTQTNCQSQELTITLTSGGVGVPGEAADITCTGEAADVPISGGEPDWTGWQFTDSSIMPNINWGYFNVNQPIDRDGEITDWCMYVANGGDPSDQVRLVVLRCDIPEPLFGVATNCNRVYVGPGRTIMGNGENCFTSPPFPVQAGDIIGVVRISGPFAIGVDCNCSPVAGGP
ncbi:MAG: chitobiase/beta-hexosaminidase C-terminal domain-containing protein, partial [Deltaproteobacteria bacterium]